MVLCNKFLLKKIAAVTFLSSVSLLVPEAVAGSNTAAHIDILKSMVRTMRYTADLINAKAAVKGHVVQDGYFCPKGEGLSCADDEKIKMRCGFPDATPDGIIRALDFNIGLKEEDKPDPDTKWLYVYKEWNKDATQILITVTCDLIVQTDLIKAVQIH